MDRDLSDVSGTKLEYHKKEMNKIMNSTGVLMFQKKVASLKHSIDSDILESFIEIGLYHCKALSLIP